MTWMSSSLAPRPEAKTPSTLRNSRIAFGALQKRKTAPLQPCRRPSQSVKRREFRLMPHRQTPCAFMMTSQRTQACMLQTGGIDKSTYTGIQRVALFAVAWLLQQVHCHTILAGSTARVGLAFCQGVEAESDVCALLALTKCTMDNRFVHNSGRSHGLLLAASAPEKWCGTLLLLTTRDAVKTWVT
mmetsp:Transcript_12858/g.25247  ORF Transcript_12858/g.25247 Transcript_12858/m.25247 type:complete len:186 (+) Transcript_12858:542-1099(+)